MKDMRAFVSEMETKIGLMKRHADLEIKRNIYGELSTYEQEELTDLSEQVEVTRNSMLKMLGHETEVGSIESDTDSNGLHTLDSVEKVKDKEKQSWLEAPFINYPDILLRTLKSRTLRCILLTQGVVFFVQYLLIKILDIRFLI